MEEIVKNSGGMTVEKFLNLLIYYEVLTPTEAQVCLMSPDHILPDDTLLRIMRIFGCN